MNEMRTTIGVLALLGTTVALRAEPPPQATAVDELAALRAVYQPPPTAHIEESAFELELSLDYGAALGVFQEEEPAEIDAAGAPEKVETGTDPRDFGNKFMPYYRYAENKNNVYINQFVAFGLMAFDPKFAMTYEIPLAKKISYPTNWTGAPGGSNPDFPSNGIPPGLLEPDGDSVGVGDFILRFFGRVDGWKWNIDEENTFEIMPTLEFTLPTATNDVLGAGSFIVAPALTFVMDIPGEPPFGLGFIASMNFYQFDAWKDGSRGSTSRYVGRHFWMQPLAKPGPGILDGIYILTEFQTVYDFMNNDFSALIAPEFGKIIKEGIIAYAKPGWGISPADNERKFTFEVGMRIFY